MIQAQPSAIASAGRAAVAIAARTLNAAAIYEGFRGQGRELTNQIDELKSARREITGQMEHLPAGAPNRNALATQLTDLGGKITAVDQMLATNSISSWIAGARCDIPTWDGVGAPKPPPRNSGLRLSSAPVNDQPVRIVFHGKPRRSSPRVSAVQ